MIRSDNDIQQADRFRSAGGLVKVIDASALAALIFDEPAGEWVAQQIRDCELLAPSLLPYEISNVCLVKIRRRSAPREMLLAALTMPGLPVDTVEVDQEAALALAEDTGLTIYDASYLWLARETGLDLITLDKALAEAQGRMIGWSNR